MRACVPILLLLLISPLSAAPQATGSPEPLSPGALIDRDLQPLAKLAQSARNKLDKKVGGMADTDPDDNVTGYAAICCATNVVRMRARLAGLEQNANRLKQGYADQGLTDGEAIAAEIATHAREARKIVEFFAAAPDAESGHGPLDRLQRLTLEINGDKKRLMKCCGDLLLPVADE